MIYKILHTFVDGKEKPPDDTDHNDSQHKKQTLGTPFKLLQVLFVLCDHVVLYAVPTIVRASLLLY